ncbi:hypothetical protein Q8F55_002867 [Vanrija albida]|uniref:Uncharacterized protein n=1 Tax=Vanrija albida TaxID=181172 RepID=A0ABR3QAX8_9TREE
MSPTTPSPPPPPYAEPKHVEPFPSASEEKLALAEAERASRHAQALTPALAGPSSPAEICALVGHDTRMAKARVVAMAALVPGSMV